MRIAWKPVGLGALFLAAGLALLAWGWARALAAPAPGAFAVLGAGVLLALLGSLMVVVPLLVPMLHRIYGPYAFAATGGACPVVRKCLRCGEYTLRGSAACKHCGAPLGAAPEPQGGS